MEHSFYPLRVVEYRHRQRLARILWGWELCGKCDAKQTCSTSLCPWRRTRVLQSFWDRYDNVTAAYVPDLTAQKPCLGSHDQLLDLIKEMKTAKNVPRGELTRRFFDDKRAMPAAKTSAADESVAVSIAACILLSTGGGTRQELNALMTDEDLVLVRWRESVSLQGFVDEAFPREIHRYFDSQQDWSRVQRTLASLAALNLVNNANFRLEATADIRQHLVIDRKRGILWVYDCTPVLKEILLATLSDAEACILPRQLVLEVMHTLYKILFPPGQASENLLSRLVKKDGFDADMLNYELARYRRDDDPVTDLSFFSVRLAEIYDELEHPTPRTQLESWFERKSDGRHMLMATMIGVFIAVIVGILGLGISGFQAYVSYQQWKHPVKDA